METFKWLHFSDLHFGAKNQEWLWPNVREELKEDILRVQKERAVIGVFFRIELASSRGFLSFILHEKPGNNPHSNNTYHQPGLHPGTHGGTCAMAGSQA